MRWENKGYYREVTADEGKLLSNGSIMTREMYMPLSSSLDEWKEVSEFVLMTPDEQQGKLDELKQQNSELQAKNQELESQWNNLDAVKARFNALGKVVKETLPVGDFLNPIPFEESIEVEQGKFYAVDDEENPDEPFVWEAKKSGIPASGEDEEYFNIIK